MYSIILDLQFSSSILAIIYFSRLFEHHKSIAEPDPHQHKNNILDQGRSCDAFIRENSKLNFYFLFHFTIKKELIGVAPSYLLIQVPTRVTTGDNRAIDIEKLLIYRQMRR